MDNTKPAATPPEPESHQCTTAGTSVAARLLALLPHPIPPWPLLLALVAALVTLAVIVLAVVRATGPALATCGVISSVVGTWVHRGKRQTHSKH
ncbi:hypothetical protein AB0M83_02600 [Amycolatopsis sp. NPDC051106]|uniref:hypothetical protein n=1 Tax=unclassified Amycolatopsis TaxID=2618356 RepID=UPI0034211180